MLVDSAELGGQLSDDCGTYAALWREVEGVGVCNDRVILLLPALVVSNAAIKMAAVIVADGITIDLGE